MYLAVNKFDYNDFHSFTWNEKDELIINGKVEDKDNWNIIEITSVVDQSIMELEDEDEEMW